MTDNMRLVKNNMMSNMVIEGRYLIKFTDFVAKHPEMAKLSKDLLGMLCNQTNIFKKRIQNRDETIYIYLQPKTLEQLRAAMNFEKKYDRAKGKTYEELLAIYGKSIPSKNLIGRLCSRKILLSESLGNSVYLIDEEQFEMFVAAIEA